MIVRVLLAAAAATFVFPAAVPAAPAPGAQGIRMTVSAGLAGAGRLGRWMPVDVDVDNRETDLTGTVVLAWGTSRVERLVSVAAPSRQTLHLFIRTGDVRDTLVATLRTADGEIARLNVPVRVVGDDEAFTVCAAGGSSPGTACSAAMAAATLPRAWRGYDTADHVLVGDMSTLDREQRDALALWRAVRAAEQRGRTLRPSMVVTERSRWTSARLMLMGYALAVCLIAVPAWRSSRRGALIALALTAIAASVAAAAHGRWSPVVVRHATVVTQFGGAPGALVDVAAVAEFPSDGAYAITPSLTDAALNVGPAYGTAAPLRFDVAGAPLLDGRFGVGARQAMQLEATAPSIVDVSVDGPLVRITNVSSIELRHCELPASFTPRSIASLASQRTIEVTAADGDDPTLLCDLAEPVVGFADPAHRVVSIGTTRMLFDAGRGGAE